jgi:hypothetical protein
VDYFSVVNYEKWQNAEDPSRKGRHQWLVVDMNVFTDDSTHSLSAVNKLCWIAILMAAKRKRNKIPNDPEWILKMAGINQRGVSLNLDVFLKLSLIVKYDPETGAGTVNLSSAKIEGTKRKERKATSPRNESWVTRLVNVWVEAKGGGDAVMYPRIGRCLKSEVARHGIDAVETAFKKYLMSNKDGEFERPEAFAAKIGDWLPKAAVSTSKKSMDDFLKEQG